MRVFTFIALVLCVSVLFPALTTKAVAQGATTTLDNLQAAYSGESNARARYFAFAQKADQEGYGKGASLFRAAARAEEIHAANHAVVIKKLGGVPQANLETPVVKSTADNLEAAIKGESYERDTMYPQFLKQARAEHNRDAVETFNFAKIAEAEHARLYTEVRNKLADMRGPGQTYYVCTVCGYTTMTLDFAKCISCFSPKHKYQAVS